MTDDTVAIYASEIIDELEMLLELSAGLLEQMDGSDTHTLSVVGDLMGKIGLLTAESGESAAMAETAEAAVAGVLDGTKQFAAGATIINDSIKWFEKQLERARAVAEQQQGDIRSPQDSDDITKGGAAVRSGERELGKSGRARNRSENTIPGAAIDVNNPELRDFVSESREYLHAAEMALLELEKTPGKIECVDEIFRGFHNIKGIAGFLGLHDVQAVAHEAESFMDRVRCGEFRLKGSAALAAFSALDFLKDMVDRVDKAISGAEYGTPAGYVELIDWLKSPETTGGAPAGRPINPKDGALINKDEKSFIEASVQPPTAPKESKTNGAKADGMVKVSTTRLDNLIDAVGELVIANAMVTQEPEICRTKNPRLSRNVSQLGKITRELQELAMSMRMVSLRQTFQKLTRVVRDLSVKCGVPVEMTYEGEETELDRNVVEEISSPLVHMVRNSVDHGIESREERIARGKPEKGRIHMSASHESGSVVIRITDDGRGLDRDAILAKAVSLKLVSPDALLTDREVYNLIFHAGFSTAKEVTDVSGRGVGMDVVRKSIDALRGRVDIDSEYAAGTTFTISLPLTLAIIDGMVVTVAEEQYIIPTISIVESVRPAAGQINTVVSKGEMLTVRGESMPLFRLCEMFNVRGAKTDARDALAVIVGSNGSRCAILVDDLIGQQQVVIKSLGKTFDRLDGVSGGAIMGDGRVAIILDATGLARLAKSN